MSEPMVTEVPMVEFLLDVAAEGYMPHPFVPHLTDKCALCGATPDRAVHDRDFAATRELRWSTVLSALPASPSEGAPT